MRFDVKSGCTIIQQAIERTVDLNNTLLLLPCMKHVQGHMAAVVTHNQRILELDLCVMIPEVVDPEIKIAYKASLILDNLSVVKLAVLKDKNDQDLYELCKQDKTHRTVH